MKKAVFYCLLFFFILMPILISAAGLVPCGGPGEKPCQLCDFFVMLKRIYDFVLWKLIPPLAALVIVYGGFLYITAFTGADSGGIEKANSLFKNVAFGLLIIYGAHLFISLLLSIIGWRWGNWWQICPGY